MTSLNSLALISYQICQKRARLLPTNYSVLFPPLLSYFWQRVAFSLFVTPSDPILDDLLSDLFYLSFHEHDRAVCGFKRRSGSLTCWQVFVLSSDPPNKMPGQYAKLGQDHVLLQADQIHINPYPTAFPYGNGMVLHFYQQQESSTTKTVHKVINKGLKTYV